MCHGELIVLEWFLIKNMELSGYTPEQIVSAYRQGVPPDQICKWLDCDSEQLQEYLESQGICVKCSGG